MAREETGTKELAQSQEARRKMPADVPAIPGSMGEKSDQAIQVFANKISVHGVEISFAYFDPRLVDHLLKIRTVFRHVSVVVLLEDNVVKSYEGVL